jgi:PAS domain-containing protein
MDKLLDMAATWNEPGTPGFPAYPLFTSASVAVMVIAQGSGRVAEANPAALALLGMPQAELVGSAWLRGFTSTSAQRLAEACQHAWIATAPIQVVVEALAGNRKLDATITTFRVNSDSYLLVRLRAHGELGDEGGAGAGSVLEELDRTSTGFVVTNSLLQVDYGNRAFLELVQAAGHEDVRGRSLAQWLALTEADLLRLREQMARRQAASLLVTTLHAGPAAGRVVELTAIAVPDVPDPCWGFTVRVLESRIPEARPPRTDA